jgi:predicted amidohydrolase
MIEPYNLTVVQPSVRPVFKNDEPFRRDALDENLERACDSIRTGARYFGSKLFLFPEFFLQGFAPGRSVDDWIEASITLPGPEVEALGQAAKDAGAYVCGMVYDVIDEFPGRFWNTSIIIDPQGEIVLKYRKLYAMTAKTRPGDVYQQYMEIFGGPESLFPVVDTPLGRLGTLICYDINFPEVTRCLALQGAEVFLHASSEGRSAYHLPNGGWEIARRTRAYENMAYLAMANCGPSIEGSRPTDFSHGHSQIVDYEGQVMNMAESAGDTMITAEIDIEALRRRRSQARINFLAEFSPAIHAPIYEAAEAWPVDRWADTPLASVAEGREVERGVIERMTENGVFAAPGSATHPGQKLPQSE